MAADDHVLTRSIDTKSPRLDASQPNLSGTTLATTDIGKLDMTVGQRIIDAIASIQVFYQSDLSAPADLNGCLRDDQVWHLQG
ncbi:hypothetical protein B6K69_17880 (plasmid) [Fuscovulum blasticum]|nr:hypothetical protein B6K69_17880 [Fuscovulum blasticum]